MCGWVKDFSEEEASNASLGATTYCFTDLERTLFLLPEGMCFCEVPCEVLDGRLACPVQVNNDINNNSDSESMHLYYLLLIFSFYI